jgi:hypothetical protein
MKKNEEKRKKRTLGGCLKRNEADLSLQLPPVMHH